MIKHSIKVKFIGIEGIKRQDNLSCHVFVNGKLYDVVGPLTRNQSQNSSIVPYNSPIQFELQALDKNTGPLYNVSFNSSLLTESHMYIPLFTLPTEIHILNSEYIGPRLYIAINENKEVSLTNETEASENCKENSKENNKNEKLKYFYHEQLEKKQLEIYKLQREISMLKEEKISEKALEIKNKNIDLVEIYLNIYLKKNNLEGLFIKYKGSLYKYGKKFVEIMIIDNKLSCRTDSE